MIPRLLASLWAPKRNSIRSDRGGPLWTRPSLGIAGRAADQHFDGEEQQHVYEVPTHRLN